jgi:hypothetical protein
VTKTNNIAILIHGVSLSLRGSGRLDTRLDTPPISLRHHPGSRIAPAGLQRRARRGNALAFMSRLRFASCATSHRGRRRSCQ